MKKLIFSVIILLFGLTPIITKAEVTQPSFFEVLENMGNLEDYKSVQSVYGDIQIDDADMKIKGEFRISSHDLVKNIEKWKSDQHSQINAYLKLTYLGEVNELKPFDHLIIEVRGEVITLLNQTLYFKLDRINLNTKGVDETDMADMEDMLEGVKQMKGVWYKIDLESVQDEAALQETYGDMADIEKITSDLKAKGLEETIKGLADESFAQMTEMGFMTQEDADQIQALIDKVFETEFFNVKEITKGVNKGFVSYNLNRGTTTEMIIDLTKQFGADFGMEEINELRGYLNKVSISGRYRHDPEYGIFDKFVFGLKLRDLDALKKLNLNYRYTINDINEGIEIIEPTEFTEFDTSGLIPQTEEFGVDEMDMDEVEMLEE